MRIGVLSLQGSSALHLESLDRAGYKARSVLSSCDLEGCDALILPGGESTTIAKLILFGQMGKALLDFSTDHPIWGTCAGAILMAKRVKGSLPEFSLSLLSILIERNAFGRQCDSFVVELSLLGREELYKAPFIRAPRLLEYQKSVQPLVWWRGECVGCREGLHLMTTFHPEWQASPTLYSLLLHDWLNPI